MSWLTKLQFLIEPRNPSEPSIPSGQLPLQIKLDGCMGYSAVRGTPLSRVVLCLLFCCSDGVEAPGTAPAFPLCQTLQRSSRSAARAVVSSSSIKPDHQHSSCLLPLCLAIFSLRRQTLSCVSLECGKETVSSETRGLLFTSKDT